MKPDLITFLTARVDEAAALEAAATKGLWRPQYDIDFPYEPGYLVYRAPTDGEEFGSGGDVGWQASKKDAEFIAATRNTALATIAAHRAIVELHTPVVTHTGDVVCKACDGLTTPCETIRHIAAIYATHPDYQQEWRVG